jgi:hypothetical protein
MFFLGQIGLGWVRGQSKVALKKKGALFGHSSLFPGQASHTKGRVS